MTTTIPTPIEPSDLAHRVVNLLLRPVDVDDDAVLARRWRAAQAVTLLIDHDIDTRDQLWGNPQ